MVLQNIIKDYGKIEKEMIEYLNFDLKVYTVFGPLTSILNCWKEKIGSELEKLKLIEDECIKLARKSFFDHLIFKYTHGAIAMSIFCYVLKKKGLGEELKQIFEKNEYCSFELQKENESIFLEIENELKTFEKMDLKILHTEAGLVLKQARELFKKSKMLDTARGFQSLKLFQKKN